MRVLGSACSLLVLILSVACGDSKSDADAKTEPTSEPTANETKPESENLTTTTATETLFDEPVAGAFSGNPDTAEASETPLMALNHPGVTQHFQNAYLDVVNVKLGPGEALPAHRGDRRLIYVVEAGQVAISEDGGLEMEETWTAGMVQQREASTYSLRNVGESSVELLIFTRSAEPLEPCTDMNPDEDIVAVWSGGTDLLLETAAMKVAQVTVEGGGSVPTHHGLNRAVLALTDLDLEFTNEDQQETHESKWNLFDVHWHEGCRHSIKNMSDDEARFLVISFKDQGE